MKNLSLSPLNCSQEWSFLTGKSVIVACSGWPDSMVLLDLFRTWILPSRELLVTHVNHNLRPTAKRDEDIVRAYCNKYSLPLEVLQADVKKEAKKTKTTIEECARNIRKSWFEKLRKKYKADYIATAHHADDQAETLLYRIIKWTSITGLVWIQAIDWPYIRPLLEYSKVQFLTYAQKHKIPYWLDETNDDVSIPRNLLRKEILPKLEIINCWAKDALLRLSISAQKLHEGFDVFFEPMLEEWRFSYDWYQGLPIGFQHELLRYLYEKANGSTHGLSLALIQELDRFLSTRNGGKKIIKKLHLVKKGGAVYLKS